AGETLLHRGTLLTSRETGALAAIGCCHVPVWKQPRVGIISSGDEIIEPGQPMQPGLVYDSNARILADAVSEAGGLPQALGIVSDDLDQLRTKLAEGLQSCDMVLLSGGTSKGGGDVSYHAVGELTDPGVVVHGVALKPGKPICLAASQRKPVVILPGFPTSAIFTFHEFVVPV
ncbi:MAG: molybdopterin biosynthesis protein, partial [Planctomycetaceae bacterium]|nr:molybdopterin biosynthesis protein [Planctomycetaceae bacterium]